MTSPRIRKTKALIKPYVISLTETTAIRLKVKLEGQERVVNAAREFLSHNGSFIASDGYTSYAVGDAEALRAAMAEYDGYLTKVPDHERVVDYD